MKSSEKALPGSQVTKSPLAGQRSVEPSSSVEPLPSIEAPPSDLPDKDDEEFDPFFEPLPRPELVFGLIGPIGVNLSSVIEAIEDSVAVAGYDSEIISVSGEISELYELDFSNSNEAQRIAKLMDAGNSLRLNSKHPEAAAVLAIFRMWEIRKERLKKSTDGRGTAFVLRSLKHPQEIEDLRALYGKAFIAISVYTPREDRVNALADKIANSSFGSKLGNISAGALARNLLDRDENENVDSGQNVRDSFPLADFFVDATNAEDVRAQLKRFLHLTFGNRFHTPSKDEHGMFQASSAALRSSDLNRQVGAAIVRPTGEIIAVGCNDVPKAGGDQYWEGEVPDARDFLLGRDSSAAQREQMLTEMLGRFVEGGLLKEDYKKKDVEKLSKSLLYGSGKPILKGAGLMNLLEFGRSVHAEMAALTTAARLGLAVEGATLYCTTFPCHMCARHIVAAGISKVVYIEPYPKSRAKQLHKDSIRVDVGGAAGSYVRFSPFHGIAPRQYQTLFSANDLRKDSEGFARKFAMTKGQLRWQRFTNSYRVIEDRLIDRVMPRLRKVAIDHPMK